MMYHSMTSVAVATSFILMVRHTVLKTISSRPHENIETDFMKDFAQKVIQHSQPSREDFDKERKRRNRICTGIVVLYSIVFLGLTCILIEVGLFLSGKFLSFFV